MAAPGRGPRAAGGRAGALGPPLSLPGVAAACTGDSGTEPREQPQGTNDPNKTKQTQKHPNKPKRTKVNTQMNPNTAQ